MRGQIESTARRHGLRAMVALSITILTASTALGEVEQAQICRGDLDHDCVITEADLILFTEHYYGVTGARSLEAMDVDDNGRIDLDDYQRMHVAVYFSKQEKQRSERISYMRGDLNNDGRITLTDAVSLLAILGGAACRVPMDAADVNKDGFIDGMDSDALLRRLFSGGAS